MIYYSSFIYTTDIDCIGRMLMIVRSFSVISLDKLLGRILIYSSRRHDVQYHQWRMNFLAHVYWYNVEMSVCVSIDESLGTHAYVDWYSIGLKRTRAMPCWIKRMYEAERFDDN